MKIDRQELERVLGLGLKFGVKISILLFFISFTASVFTSDENVFGLFIVSSFIALLLGVFFSVAMHAVVFMLRELLRGNVE